MLLQFSTQNFMTFKNKVTLSLIAADDDKATLEDENVFVDNKFKFRLLKSAVVYGANASGKSKLIDAFSFMKEFVTNSSKEGQNGEDINIQPFRLSKESEDNPSEFEVVFIFNDNLFRYGFEATKHKIISEWLYHKTKTKEVELFFRNENNFEINSRKFSKGAAIVKEGLVRNNALLVSVAAQFNEEKAIAVVDWFKRLKVISGLSEMNYMAYSMRQAEVPNRKMKIIELLKAADFGIQDINIRKLNIKTISGRIPKDLREYLKKEIAEQKAEFVDIITTHKIYDSSQTSVETINFLLDIDESSGTRKFFALTGPILDVIENGYTLIIDELDAKLHPNLVCKIISLFNSSSLNNNNAQLIFNTHNTNLLDSGLFRRDQIWFTEKDKYGEAKLYSLANFKSGTLKKKETVEANYINGKYGAVPYLGFFDHINFNVSHHEHEEEK